MKEFDQEISSKSKTILKNFNKKKKENQWWPIKNYVDLMNAIQTLNLQQ